MCGATWWQLSLHCTPPGLWGLLPQPSLLSPLQGKEEFEKTQKELLEKGNIMRQGKGQLELQQVRTLRFPGFSQHRLLCQRTQPSLGACLRS